MEWSYFNKFNAIDDKYLPTRGEGETKATQINTAVSKLVYKCYNDGDVFDNTKYLSGWCNDLSSYANWLWKYVPETKAILEKVWEARTYEEYENMLAELADAVCTESFLGEMSKFEKVGTIYKCDGPFRFDEKEYEDEDEEYYEDEDEEYV